MPEPEAKIIDAEVVHTAQRRNAEPVRVSRIPAGALLRGVFENGATPETVAKRVRELQLRFWLWLVGFAAIAGGCFYGAATVDTVIWSAFLILAGLACACAMSVVWLLIRALRRLQLH